MALLLLSFLVALSSLLMFLPAQLQRALWTQFSCLLKEHQRIVTSEGCV